MLNFYSLYLCLPHCLSPFSLTVCLSVSLSLLLSLFFSLFVLFRHREICAQKPTIALIPKCCKKKRSKITYYKIPLDVFKFTEMHLSKIGCSHRQHSTLLIKLTTGGSVNTYTIASHVLLLRMCSSMILLPPLRNGLARVVADTRQHLPQCEAKIGHACSRFDSFNFVTPIVLRLAQKLSLFRFGLVLIDWNWQVLRCYTLSV